MTAPHSFGRNVRIEGARIAGVVSALPPMVVGNDEFVARFGEESVRDVVKMIGVESRHWTDENTTSADLCLHAAGVLVDRLGWPKDAIDALIYVTQTPDYRLPATACVLQRHLGLSSSCAAFDVNLGCSGYVYGLWLAMSLVASGSCERVLLLVGDTISKTVSPDDRSTALLFGDAGTATAVERGAAQETADFVLGTDGTGASNLMIPVGAFRRWQRSDGRLDGRDTTRLFMDGSEIFNFTLKLVPGLITHALARAGLTVEQVDAFVFHQANLFMLKHLAKKAKIPADRMPINIQRFGNTSNASIPLLLTSELGSNLAARRMSLALAGFGVGYSWAAAVLDVGPLRCADTVIL